MKIVTFNDIKSHIGSNVKLGKIDGLPNNLKDLSVIIGKLEKVVSHWEHTPNGDVCISWYACVNVTDTGGVISVNPREIFSSDTVDVDIVNSNVIEEKEKLEKRLAELDALIK